jgi:hypothetical protein
MQWSRIWGFLLCWTFVAAVPMYVSSRFCNAWSWLFKGYTDFLNFSEERQTHTSASNSLTGYEYVIVGK